MDEPERRHRLIVDLQADDLDSLLTEVDDLSDLLRADETATTSFRRRANGYDLAVCLYTNPAVTAASYREARNAWENPATEGEPTGPAS